MSRLCRIQAVPLDHFGEVGIDLDHRAPALELRRAEILKPMVGAFHAIEHPFRSIGERHHGGLDVRRDRRRREQAVDGDLAVEDASKSCGVIGLGDDAGTVGGEADEAYSRVRCPNHAMSCA